LGYMEVQLGLSDLVESKMLRLVPNENELVKEPMYRITEWGEQVLGLNFFYVRGSLRDRVDALCDQWRARFTRERQIFADYQRVEGNRYSVVLGAQEFGEKLITVQMETRRAEDARFLCDRWKERAAKAYMALMDALCAEEDKPQEDKKSE